MSNSPDQVPNPTTQPQQPQAPPQVSDKTIDAFMAVSDDKKREALGKMSEPTKQALLQGIQKRKGVQTPNQPKSVEKAMPFSSGVASGMMLDPSAIAKQKTTEDQVLEVGKEMGRGALDLGKSILKDPLNVGNPIDAIVKGQQSAYKKVHEGLKSGNHDELMNGLGEAVGNLSMLLGGAKTEEGIGVASTARDASFAAKDLTSKRAIVSAASHGALDTLKDEHSASIDTAVKAERARIGGNVEALNIKDVKADPKGYVPQKLALATLDQAVSDKKAQVLLDKRMMPKVAQVRGLLEGHAQNLTFNDLKQVRSVVGEALGKATGVERAVLGDYYSSLTKNLKGRAAHLGGLPEWEDYNESAEKLADHERGLIPELKDSKTGLDYYKKIVSESNKPRLDKLVKDLHMPSDFFDKATKGPVNKIAYFAKLSEGDSFVSKLTNRLIAMRKHPIVATMGAAAGGSAGKAIGNALGMPLVGTFAGIAFGAGLAHDLISKYDAAKAIREIGGPSGVMGVRPSAKPPSGASQAGPGAGGPSTPQGPSATPPGSPPPAPRPVVLIDRASLSPALAKLVPEGKELGGFSTEKTIREGYQEELKKPSDRRQNVELRKAIDKLKDSPNEALGHFQKAAEAARKSEAKATPEVTKVPEGQRGREPSTRSGMTKDTPEARRAKAAERIAARRAEASRTNIKGSIEDQARQVAGRMDFQGKSNIELEEGLQELYGENGKRFMAGFKQIAKQKKWSDDVYRGYLIETIDKRVEELAKRPNIPGLSTEPKVE